MSFRAMFAILFLLSALIVIALDVNFSQQSKATAGGMSYQALMSDPEFIRAVKSVVETCSVNVDIAKLKC
jgi:uncharacterized secreted protein with C-terminal beta-propeller domain